MARCIFAWLLAILVYFFFTHSMLHQLNQPVLKYPGSDNTFWVVYASGIAAFFVEHKWAAILFDVVLVVSCLSIILFPQKKILAWIAVIGIWLLYIFYGAAAGKHYAQIGYLLTPIPFIVSHPKKFDLLWNAVRYWVCFLYVFAGVSKVWGGGFLYDSNMSHILIQDQALGFVFLKEGIKYDIYHYLIENPSVAQWLYRAAAIFEFACIVGFFTKKMDKWILVALLSFHCANLFLLDISFVEQSLIFAPFLPWKKWAVHFQYNKNNG
jgi:hypothetical protein